MGLQNDLTTSPNNSTFDDNHNKGGEYENKNYSCKHYKRKCQFVSPCCQKLYRCRFCHDEAEDHTLDRFSVREVVCSKCSHRQEISPSCVKCQASFGAYHCLKCKLFDDDLSRHQFHCDGCGICRVGKASDYFHCDKCDMCLPVHMRGKHVCIESVSRKDCPVCLEDIHTSREPSQIPPCHHLIHRSCFNQLRRQGYYRCPVCLRSMFTMPWEDYDAMLASNPMPARFDGVLVKIKCFDCDSNGDATYHFISLKCGSCGSHNTARANGPLFKLINGKVVEFDIQSGGDAAAAATSQTVEIPGSDGVQQQSDPEERRSSSDGSHPASAEDQEEVLTRTSSNASLDSWAEFEARNFHEAFLSAGEVEDED